MGFSCTVSDNTVALLEQFLGAPLIALTVFLLLFATRKFDKQYLRAGGGAFWRSNIPSFGLYVLAAVSARYAIQYMGM